LVFEFKRGPWIKGIWEQGVEGTWTEEGWVTGVWRIGLLHNEERRDLYSSPSIIRMIKTRMWWRVM
jgi:hypothetical protein